MTGCNCHESANGRILALVSEPTFENNRMTRYIPAYYYQQLSLDQSKPLLNHATQVAQPPGSVFKIVTGIGAINEKWFRLISI